MITHEEPTGDLRQVRKILSIKPEYTDLVDGMMGPITYIDVVQQRWLIRERPDGEYDWRTSYARTEWRDLPIVNAEEARS